MSFLIDTNTLSAHIRRPSGLAHRFTQHSGRLYLSTVSLAEFYVWIYRRENVKAALDAVEKLLYYEVSIIGFDQEIREDIRKTRVEMRRRGLDANPVDLMIASVALVHDLTLVTNNTRDFRNIPDLRFEDWLNS